VALVLAGVAAALAVALAGPAGAAGSADAGATTPDADFDRDRYTVAEGDVASITVTLTDTDTATVNVGSRDAGYLARATVTDGDGDGQVTLRVNLFEAGGWRGTPAGGVYDTADPDDSVSVTRVTRSLDDPLEPFAYDLNVSVDGAVYAAATLFVEERETRAARSLTAPGSAAPSDLSSGAAVSDVVAVGDYVAVQVEATGVFGYLRDADDLASGTQGLSLEVVQTNPGPNEVANELALSDATYVPAPERDSFFVVFDTGAVDVTPGERYRATFTVGDSNPLTDGTESVETTFEVRAVTAAVDGSVSLEPEPNQRITGSTTLAAGSELTIRVESQNPSEPFLERIDVTVDAGGAWDATLDLSSFSDGTTLRTTVRHDGERIGGPANLTIGAPSATFEITAVDVPDTITAGETVSATATVENTGDVEGTATVELRVSGRVVDSQELTLGAGERRRSTFTIDTEGVPTGTYEYTVVVGEASRSGTVDVVEATATPTVEPTTPAPPTVPPTETPTVVTPTTTPPPTPEPTTTREYTPVTATPADTTALAPTATAATGTGPRTITRTTNAPANATTTAADGTSDDGTAISFEAEGSPGFVPAAAVLALAATLWLRRRR